MKRIFIVVWALVAPGAVGFAQTNSSTAAAGMPPIRTLQLPAAPAREARAVSSPGNSGVAAGPMSTAGDPATIPWSTQMEREWEGKLVSPVAPTYGEGWEGGNWPANRAAAFKPKITQVGHARIYTSVGTAVARKNPLCLLDPTFLHISF